MHSVLSLSLAMHIHRCFHNWDGVHAWMDCLSNVASTTLWGPRSCSGCHPGAGLRHWHCNHRGTNHRRNMRSIYISSFILRKWIWVAKDFFPSIVIYQVRLPNIYFSPAVCSVQTPGIKKWICEFYHRGKRFGFSHICHMRFALDFTFGVKFSLDLGCSCIQFVH